MGVGENLDNAKQKAEELKMSFRDYQNVLKGINEGLGVKNDKVKDATKEYTALIGIARQFAAVEEGILDLSDQQLQKAFEKAQQGRNNLKDLAKGLKLTKDTSDEEKELIAARKEGFPISRDLIANIKEELEIRGKVNTAMGVAGGLMEGIADATGAFGRALNIDKVVSGMKKFADEQIRSNKEVSRSEVLWKGATLAAEELMTTLTDPAVIITSIGAAIGRMDGEMKKFRQTTGQNINAIDTLNTGLITSTEYVKTANMLSKEFGRNAALIFTPEDIAEVTELVENMGMDEESASRLAMLAKVQGKTVKEAAKNVEAQFKTFVKQNKVALNFGDVMNNISDVSLATSLSLGGSEEAIAEAAMSAAKLGVSMETIEGAASALLDFESSISAELEAELLTGKSINLEKARQAALNNDIAALSEEIGKNEAVLGAFSSGNRIQQEAIAKAMGMTREDVAKIVFQKQLDKGLSLEAAAAASDISLEEAKRLSTQEQLSKAMDKVAEAAASVLKALSPIIENATVMKALMAAIALIIVTKMAKGLSDSVKSMKDMVKSGAEMVKGGFKGIKDKVSPDKTKLPPTPKKGHTKQAGKGIEGFLKGLANGLKYLGKNLGAVLKGALALGVIGIIMAGSFAIAMMMLKDVDPVMMIAFSASLAILGLTMAVLGNIGPNIILGAAAMLILGLALIPAAFAFSLLEGVDIGKMIAFSLALPLLALAAAGLGFLAPFIMWGAAALAVLGLAMIPAAYAFSLLKDVDLTAFTDAMTGLVGGPIIAGMFKLGAALGAVGWAIKKFAFSMGVLSFFSAGGLLGGGPLRDIKELALMADPLASTADALMRMSVALQGVGTAISTIDATTLNTLEEFASKSAIASAAQGITSAITAPIQAIGGMFGGGKENKEHQELMSKLDQLIAATEDGKIIEMDGQKVGKSVAMNSSRIG